MESLKSLENIDNNLSEKLLQIKSFPFARKEFDEEIRNLTLNIKKELKVDYSVKIKYKPKEKEHLEKIFIEYLIGKSDTFNSHYIQLLAWNLIDLKVMNVKKIGKQSIFEYSPNPLAPYTVIERTFRLFQKKRIDPEKISYALILNYLNNYKIVSNRYKSELRRYLKTVKFSEDLYAYFNLDYVIDYTIAKSVKNSNLVESYQQRLIELKINPRTLDTVYFAEAWFAWMFRVADLTNLECLLKNLNCNFFKICNENMQKLVFAKIIHDNSKWYGIRQNPDELCLKYIFPLIKKGSPFTKEYWDLNYTGAYKMYLDFAWIFVEQNFVKNNSYKNMVNFEV